MFVGSDPWADSQTTFFMVVVEDQEFEFLTIPQMALISACLGPHYENHWTVKGCIASHNTSAGMDSWGG